jgi:hypothetical protein
MKLDRRKTQAAVVEAIRSRAASYEIAQVLDLLDLLREDAKESLLTCGADEFGRLQGEGQAYDKLVRLLTRPSVQEMQRRTE